MCPIQPIQLNSLCPCGVPGPDQCSCVLQYLFIKCAHSKDLHQSSDKEIWSLGMRYSLKAADSCVSWLICCLYLNYTFCFCLESTIFKTTNVSKFVFSAGPCREASPVFCSSSLHAFTLSTPLDWPYLLYLLQRMCVFYMQSIGLSLDEPPLWNHLQPPFKCSSSPLI